MARTANRLIEVIALSQVNWVAFRIVVDTGHLQISNSMLRLLCYLRVNISISKLLLECCGVRMPGTAVE